MFIKNGLFTSESVSPGHPDKLADQISDAILDCFMELDCNSRVACETFIANNLVLIAGEFKTSNEKAFQEVRNKADNIARKILRDVGYKDGNTGIDPDQCKVLVHFNCQSADIAQGVELTSGEFGAGDQGMMFGYSTCETEEKLPLTLVLAHRLLQQHALIRKSNSLPWLGPDAKSQVTLRYIQDMPLEIESIVLSTQHSADINIDTVRKLAREYIIEPVIKEYSVSKNLAVHINPTGRFIIGGPKSDTGLTGRKIIVDTYGGAAPHGGGAFSGKDPTKVDRSAAYMARYLANQVVHRKWAERCLIQLSYAIGLAKPLSFLVHTHGLACNLTNEEIQHMLLEEFNLTPYGIIKHLNLLQPIYLKTATYGHFGRKDVKFPWEEVI